MQASAIPNKSVMQGDYLLLTQIGGEPDCQVYRGRARRDGHAVAIRLIQQSHLALFGSEPILGKAQVASRLRHPALAAVEAYGQEGDDTWFIVSEFVEGPRLDEWADALGIPPLVDLIDMIHRVCHGLQAAHRAGLAHDSLHPGNLIILPRLAKPSSPLDVKIMDLSVPSLVRPWPPHLQAAAFMAPEQLRLDDLVSSSADVRTNVYSCGALLYYLCTGGTPYQSRSLEDLANQHRDAKLIPPSKINPRIPASLEEAILRALAPDPRARFSSTAELGNALALIRLPIRLSSGVRPRVTASQSPAPAETWSDQSGDFVERSTSETQVAAHTGTHLSPPKDHPDEVAPVFPPAAQQRSTPSSTPSWKPPLGSFSNPEPQPATDGSRDSGVGPVEEWHAVSSFFPAAPARPPEQAFAAPAPAASEDAEPLSDPPSSPTLVLPARQLQQAGDAVEPLELLESLESLESLEMHDPDASPEDVASWEHPNYRLHFLMHGWNLAFLGGVVIAGAALGPLAWLVGALIEAASFWIIPDLARFRARVDLRSAAEHIARERSYCLRELFGLAKEQRSLGQKLLDLFVEGEERNVDDRIIDQKNEGVRIYRELCQLATELNKIELMRGGQVIAHEQLLERMINRYLGLLLVRRLLAASLSGIDADALTDQVQRVEQQLTRATPDARLVLAESRQQYRSQLEKLLKLQAGLELVWERMETTRRELRDLHRRVIGDSALDVRAQLDELMTRRSLAADPFAEMRTDRLMKELLVRPASGSGTGK